MYHKVLAGFLPSNRSPLFIPRLFEDATDKLNLMALGSFLYQLKKASQSQLFHSVTDTVDYSLAMPGNYFSDGTVQGSEHETATSPRVCFLLTRSYWCSAVQVCLSVLRRNGGGAASTAGIAPEAGLSCSAQVCACYRETGYFPCPSQHPRVGRILPASNPPLTSIYVPK